MYVRTASMLYKVRILIFYVWNFKNWNCKAGEINKLNSNFHNFTLWIYSCLIYTRYARQCKSGSY